MKAKIQAKAKHAIQLTEDALLAKGTVLQSTTEGSKVAYKDAVVDIQKYAKSFDMTVEAKPAEWPKVINVLHDIELTDELGESLVIDKGTILELYADKVAIGGKWILDMSKQSKNTQVLKDGGYYIKDGIVTPIPFDDSMLVLDGTTMIAVKDDNIRSADIVRLPYGITELAVGALAMSSMQELYLPDSITKIHTSAVSQNSNLRILRLSKNLTYIGDHAISSCPALTDITLPNTLQTIDNSAFASSGLTSVTIPSSVRQLNDMIFNGCTSLRTATIMPGIETIPSQTFNDCTALEHVSIPETVTTIENQAFAQTALTDIKLPDSLVTLGNAKQDAPIFMSTNITNLTIPKNVVNIIGMALYSMGDLVSFTFESATVVYPYDEGTVGSNAKLTTIYVHPDLLEAYQEADGWDMSGVTFLPIEA